MNKMTLNNVPESLTDLLSDEARAFAYLATIMPDGSPQVTPVWFNTDGKHLLFNSAKGRVKDRNMRSRPQIAVVIHLQENPLRYIQLRGEIVEIGEDGAREHINMLSLKYTGNPEFKIQDPDQIRVMYKLLPRSIQVSG
jgi:PPOX class probable F420-dependent enzyme